MKEHHVMDDEQAPRKPGLAAATAHDVETARLLHELRVHQVELETQNEELRESQALLEASRSRYADLYDFSPIAYFTFDRTGCVAELNLTAAAMLGIERSRVIGKPFTSVVSFENPTIFFDLVRATCMRREAQTAELMFLRRGDGASVTMHVVSAPSQAAHGGATHCSCAFWDVTEQRRAERDRALALQQEQAARASAEAANQLKDEFLGVVSHELRTPLNAIVGWGHILASKEDLGPDLLRRGLDVIFRNASAQTRLVEDLLDMSRIVTSKMRIESEPVALEAVVRAAVDSFQPMAEERRVSLTGRADVNVAVMGDTERLQQVVANLISNAIKFSDRGGKVEVSLEVQGADACISVKDNGRGIAPEALGWIFDRFRQVESSRARSYGGLGLGLSIARHIVEAHGGRIDANSTGVGMGSTFKIALPREISAAVDVQPRAALPANPPSWPRLRRAQGITALVVDDDRDTLEITSLILQREGAEVIAAGSAEEALEALAKRTPDILLSDIGMPGQDGFALIARVRALPSPAKDLPAVALTAYARDDDAERARNAGYDVHVAKPFEPDHLIEKVVELCDDRATQS